MGRLFQVLVRNLSLLRMRIGLVFCILATFIYSSYAEQNPEEVVKFDKLISSMNSLVTDFNEFVKNFKESYTNKIAEEGKNEAKNRRQEEKEEKEILISQAAD